MIRRPPRSTLFPSTTLSRSLSIAYGESEIEAMSTGLTAGRHGGNYLGTNLLEVPALGTARGPKSGFRYVRISFLRGAATTTLDRKSTRLNSSHLVISYAVFC